MVLDSGSDATVIPSCSYAPAGLQLGSGSPLWEHKDPSFERMVAKKFESSWKEFLVKDHGEGQRLHI